MIKISPFKAIRPIQDKAHLVASRAVSTYNEGELATKLDTNPFTFIHIIHPEFFEDETNSTKPNTEERFLKVKNKYEEFVENGILQQDQTPSLYVYQQTTPEHTYLGVIGGASVKDYVNNKIKKHEATISLRESMFTNYLGCVGFNAEPVLLCHKKNKNIDALLANITKKQPAYNFTTTDKINHQLWVVDEGTTKEIQSAFEQIDNCYIADGHHRSASSVKYCEQMKNSPNYSVSKNYNSFLSFFIDEERLNIMPFNRIAKTLNGLSVATILSQLNNHFDIRQMDCPHLPKQLHEFGMYVNGKWYCLNFKIDNHLKLDAVSSIDAEILTRYVLAPILGINDLTNDDNIHFINKKDNIRAVEQSVDGGVYKIGFTLFPVTTEQLKAVADEGAIMPPKSTWIEPKMRSGLTIFKLDE